MSLRLRTLKVALFGLKSSLLSLNCRGYNTSSSCDFLKHLPGLWIPLSYYSPGASSEGREIEKQHCRLRSWSEAQLSFVIRRVVVMVPLSRSAWCQWLEFLALFSIPCQVHHSAMPELFQAARMMQDTPSPDKWVTALSLSFFRFLPLKKGSFNSALITGSPAFHTGIQIAFTECVDQNFVRN